jgi:hypothetical protein
LIGISDQSAGQKRQRIVVPLIDAHFGTHNYLKLLFMMIIGRITMLLNEIIPPCTLEIFAHHFRHEF